MSTSLGWHDHATNNGSFFIPKAIQLESDRTHA